MLCGFDSFNCGSLEICVADGAGPYTGRLEGHVVPIPPDTPNRCREIELWANQRYGGPEQHIATLSCDALIPMIQDAGIVQIVETNDLPHDFSDVEEFTDAWYEAIRLLRKVPKNSKIAREVSEFLKLHTSEPLCGIL